MTQDPSSFTPAPPAPASVLMCAAHPSAPAVSQCAKCGIALCETCQFAFPDGLRLCPACATDTRVKLSATRKAMAWGSVCLGAWSTLITIAVVCGAFGRNGSKTEEEAMGMLVSVLGFIPCIIGVALGFGSMDRRRGNTPMVYVGAGWNSLILALWVILIIIGLTMGRG